MKKISGGFRVGAASFYVVVFSTLILAIMATSFVAATIAEMTRSANDELSQSAYDSAMVGVEDAKLAFVKYRDCVHGDDGNINPDELALTAGDGVECNDIIYWVKKAPDCDMVAHILGRIPKNESGEVVIKETVDNNRGNNSMEQAYTCVKIDTELKNVQALLDGAHPYYIAKVNLAGGVSADAVGAVRISWYIPDDRGDLFNGENFMTNLLGESRLVFKPSTEAPSAPPTIAVQLLQTAEEFTFGQIESSTIYDEDDAKTDRATVFLVPTNRDDLAMVGNDTNNFYGVYDEETGINKLTAEQVADTNNMERNVPYVVYCDENAGSGYVCSATLTLPRPIGGTRNDDTFMFVVSLPYEQPETAFLLEFFCDGNNCGDNSIVIGDGGDGTPITVSEKMGVSIDSTGRANDLYRRVEVRITDSGGTESPISTLYALELLKEDGEGNGLNKNLTIRFEKSH